jgi:hypothetical protein
MFPSFKNLIWKCWLLNDDSMKMLKYSSRKNLRYGLKKREMKKEHQWVYLKNKVNLGHKEKKTESWIIKGIILIHHQREVSLILKRCIRIRVSNPKINKLFSTLCLILMNSYYLNINVILLRVRYWMFTNFPRNVLIFLTWNVLLAESWTKFIEIYHNSSNSVLSKSIQEV